MSKWRFSCLFVLVFVWIVLKNSECLYFNNYPVIHLPEQAHNTIGEIPIIEHIDDGQVHTNPYSVQRSSPVQQTCGYTWCGNSVIEFDTPRVSGDMNFRYGGD